MGDRLFEMTDSFYTKQDKMDRALNFVSHLLEASSEVKQFEDDMKSARFLQELVEFGCEVVKVKSI
jgi:hypothetical protein